jgi:uncharacterized protein (TIGR02597 family)
LRPEETPQVKNEMQQTGEEKDMRHKASAIAVVVLLAFAATAAAQVGRIGRAIATVPANGDAKLVMPFTGTIYGTFQVTGKPNATDLTATQLGGTAVLAGQFNQLGTPGALNEDFLYYIRFVGGNATGLWMSIATNSVAAGPPVVHTFTLDNTAAVHLANFMNQVNVGDTFRVYRHHNLSTLFPPARVGISYVVNTEVFFYKHNTGAMVNNPAAAASAKYRSVGGVLQWSGTGKNRPFLPETMFVVRNPGATALKIAMVGVMPDYKVSMLIAPGGDLKCSTGYPVPVALKVSQLNGVPPAGSGLNREVFFYDNTVSENNGASYWTAKWRSVSGVPQWTGTGAGRSLVGYEASSLRLPGTETANRVYVTKPY